MKRKPKWKLIDGCLWLLEVQLPSGRLEIYTGQYYRNSEEWSSDILFTTEGKKYTIQTYSRKNGCSAVSGAKAWALQTALDWVERMYDEQIENIETERNKALRILEPL